MRKKIVAGNWKMNTAQSEGQALVADIRKDLPQLDANHIVVIAPPAIQLSQIANQIRGITGLFAGAQNVHHESSGAFTGELSAGMLKDAGAQYVIIGHSERRAYNCEDDKLLAQKVKAALAAGLNVLFCCGEPLEVRERNAENDYVASQISAGLSGVAANDMRKIAVAYEPIWAIGTGRTASADQAQAMHAHIRKTLTKLFNEELAAVTPVLYGGSCKPSNAAELFACADVDGGLIGGASLKADEFLAVVNAMLGAG